MTAVTAPYGHAAGTVFTLWFDWLVTTVNLIENGTLLLLECVAAKMRTV